MSTTRPKVVMSIDYSIRIPDFITIYSALKAEIFVGAFAQTEEMLKQASKNVNQSDFDSEFSKADIDQIKEKNKIIKDQSMLKIDKRNFWNELNETDPAAVQFYKTTKTPTANVGGDFDLSYLKYFYNREHCLKFLQEYSYNLFGAGQVTNKMDVDIINTAQSKICDIVLFDRTPYARKVPNTFAFLSRSGLYVRSVVFVTSEKEIEELKKDAVGIWDPKVDVKQCIDFPKTANQPTQNLLEFFMDVEKKIKK